jgi:hypothetical protein
MTGRQNPYAPPAPEAVGAPNASPTGSLRLVAVLAGIAALGAGALACLSLGTLFQLVTLGAVTGPAFLGVAVAVLGLLGAGVRQLLARGARGKALILSAALFVVFTQLTVRVISMEWAAVVACVGGVLSLWRLSRLHRRSLA